MPQMMPINWLILFLFFIIIFIIFNTMNYYIYNTPHNYSQQSMKKINNFNWKW